MPAHRLLTLGPDDEPIWVWLDVQPVEDRCADMRVADRMTPPGPGEAKGL
jgi:hypothetical protein